MLKRLTEMRFRAFFHEWWASLVVAFCLLVIVGTLGWRLTHTGRCQFCPVEFKRLTIMPTSVRPGDLTTLLDGICNETSTPLAAEFYLGAQQVDTPSFRPVIIDLLPAEGGGLIRDTPEGRLRRTLDPGCTSLDPISAPLPATFTPGLWVITAHVVVIGPTGQVQNINKSSNQFAVLP